MSRREKIERLGLVNPIVRACLDAHRYHQGVTYQDALEEMVIGLAESLQALQAEQVRMLSTMLQSPPAYLDQCGGTTVPKIGIAEVKS